MAPAEAPLPLPGSGSACTVHLLCLPGASGVHVVLSDGSGVRLRAEVAADPGETIPLQIEVDDQGLLHLWSHGRNILFLPAESRYDPAPPIRPASPETDLDLAIVIDGTTRHFFRKEKEATQSVPLLEKKDLWAAHVEKLVGFAKGLALGRDSRCAVLAFGDQDPPQVKAQDLLPEYHLYPPPEERRFHSLDVESLRQRLLTIPSTSGADFVDALADVLAACAALRWRKKARKLIVLSGDSPGHSILHPLRKGADLCARERDVETQVLRLHRDGVEVVTLYHPPAADLGFYSIGFQRDLLQGARAQYARLASLPEMAFEETSFDPEKAAEWIRQLTAPIASGASLGELIDAGKGVEEAPDAVAGTLRRGPAGSVKRATVPG